MTLIHLHSEPFSRDGNIAADGAARLLGQPALSPLELVIRESIQNSWDASLEIKGTPQYSEKSDFQRSALGEPVLCILVECLG